MMVSGPGATIIKFYSPNFNSFQEFLLGESILAAPVIERNKYVRDIYLPNGTGIDGNSGIEYEGKLWLRDYNAPLDLLPFFIRKV